MLSLPRRVAEDSLQAVGRVVLATASHRERLNRRYRGWSLDGQARFYHYFAKSFREGSADAEPGSWTVEFAGRTITVPLRPERMWLDWDHALSIVGQDVEIKRTYDACLRSAEPPEVFLDIGANYGLHSVLFLAHGVEAIAFEPNPSCHQDFREICDRNGLAGRIEGVALGDRPGEVDLVYPERETWLGTIHPGWFEESIGAGDADEVRVQRVPRKTLDDYLGELGGRRVLMKVDTEGSEYEVLSGGAETLETLRPLTIFESFADAGPDRRELHALLQARGYDIASLPWRPELPSPALDEAAFIANPAVNFIATPRA